MNKGYQAGKRNMKTQLKIFLGILPVSGEAMNCPSFEISFVFQKFLQNFNDILVRASTPSTRLSDSQVGYPKATRRIWFRVAAVNNHRFF